MFRRPGGGRSKASADTLCQKCLKRDIYECTVSAQDRPYKSRPSRTQQLLNPDLRPKLSAEVPNELLRKKGTADDILKKKEEERERRSSLDRKRSRSASISSMDSISTVSTNRSRSRGQSPRRQHDKAPRRERETDSHRKRARRSVSMDSRSSEEPRANDRNTRRRMSSFSPGPRGRRRSRSRSSRMETSPNRAARHKHRHHRKPRSKSPDGSYRVRSRSRSRHRNGRRPIRQRSASRSPDRMDTSADLGSRIGASYTQAPQSPPVRRLPSRSPSPYRNERQRSLSPFSKRKALARSTNEFDADPNDNRGRASPRPRNRFDAPPAQNGVFIPQPQIQPPPASRERSLSPYSKRVALTRMQHAG